MNLLIDIGNTNTHIGIAGPRNIVFDFKVPTKGRLAAAQIAQKLRGYRKRIERVAISSVAPEKNAFWKVFAMKYLDIKPFMISTTIKLPISINPRIFSSFGSDRICSAVGAYYYFKQRSNVIAIDLGTATTYNVVLKKGIFAGGAISAGIGTSARALHEYTGKLPLISPRQLVFPRKVTGTNTLDAMLSGLMYGASLSIEGMIREIEKELRGKFRVIMTGGNGKYVHKKIGRLVKYEPHLVLLGMNHILNYNN